MSKVTRPHDIRSESRLANTFKGVVYAGHALEWNQNAYVTVAPTPQSGLPSVKPLVT